MDIKRRLYTVAAVLYVCFLISICDKAYALYAVEDGQEDVTVQKAYEDNKARKDDIADKIQAQKREADQENAALVKKIEEQIAHKAPSKEQKGNFANILAAISMVLFAVYLFISRRKK